VKVDKTAVGLRLKALRDDRNLSRSELASLLGFIGETIRKWERGKAAPRSNTVKWLADFYGISMNYILDGVAREENELERKLNAQLEVSEPAETKPEISVPIVDMNKRAVGLRLNALRNYNDLTRSDLAELLEINTHLLGGGKRANAHRAMIR
jgi:transcriptional regulator with XRE-family HTH domain